jgi:hypothetical protein
MDYLANLRCRNKAEFDGTNEQADISPAAFPAYMYLLELQGAPRSYHERHTSTHLAQHATVCDLEGLWMTFEVRIDEMPQVNRVSVSVGT